jgi:hypothetical protein
MGRIFRHENMFALVIGLTDGILTALTLASGKVFSSTEPITIGLALRISAASSLSGVFVFFAAEYMRQRGALVHAERQLSLAFASCRNATRASCVTRHTLGRGNLQHL